MLCLIFVSFIFTVGKMRSLSTVCEKLELLKVMKKYLKTACYEFFLLLYRCCYVYCLF